MDPALGCHLPVGWAFGLSEDKYENFGCTRLYFAAGIVIWMISCIKYDVRIKWFGIIG